MKKSIKYYLNFSLILDEIILRSQKRFFKKNFEKFGKDIKIYGRINIIHPENVSIGNNSTLNHGCLINASEKVVIGSFCRISASAKIHTGGLDLKKSYKVRSHINFPITINDGVWIGSGAVITSNITIGEGSVVAANSVVTKDIPSFELWGGVPAKKIKSLKNETKK